MELIMKRVIAWTMFILLLLGGMAIGYYGATAVGGTLGYLLSLLGILCAAISALLVVGILGWAWNWMTENMQ